MDRWNINFEYIFKMSLRGFISLTFKKHISKQLQKKELMCFSVIPAFTNKSLLFVFSPEV